MKGVVFDIKRYAVNDGDGIRVTVFLKGCPLRCMWCHNPESQKMTPQMSFFQSRCIRCVTCETVCPEKAIKIADTLEVHDNCTLCGTCVDECPADALEIIGYYIAAEEVIESVCKDELFFDSSKGGVTFSGGEPFAQPEFLRELLKLSKEKRLNTSVDTSGYTDFANIEACNQYIDTYLYDIKMMDDDKHKKYTGVSNRLILENLKKLDEIAADIRVRIPLIPGVNDDVEEIDKIYDFIKDLKSVKGVDLLPYHNIMIDKYLRLGMDVLVGDIPEIDKNKINYFKEFFEKNGFSVLIGG
ncbi:pyruvate formate-lyase activating enzyme [Deferribacter desulfuricans SSM1]|uniref:Pyruvate formate-lyase activating enzyme n=1 Tax=Deferribacter desulfuricans (strain DSM 14783 / JCM 11476 / NBRC 101012 / SSM1) TaxID=639282 RepID=D3PA12_DEFDS|nr:glycyl-radical enzyme activating protein [Deferribacter desulfuricans]BAI81552.1 pyruvate formate-lyase activating enzyme [Deferribacter desulfuricans SSM1]